MRLDEPIEAAGTFWLPENPDIEVPGTIQISESGRVTLETIGHLGGTDAAMDRLKTYQELSFDEPMPQYQVLGYSDKLGCIRLDDCVLQEPVFSMDFAACTAYSNYALVTRNDSLLRGVSFSRFNFSLVGLDEWLDMSGFKVEQDYDNLSSREINISFKRPERVTFSISDELELAMDFSCGGPSITRTITEIKMSQTAYFSLISSESKSDMEFVSMASMIRDFVSLGIGQPVLITSMVGFSEDKISDGSRDELITRVYCNDGRRSVSESTVIKPLMSFAYDDISDKFGSILGKWIANYKKYNTSFSLYFNSISDDSKLLDIKFLRIVQAMETLHRGYFNEQDVELRRRLAGIFNSTLSSRIKNNRRKKLVNDVVATRNYLTHYSDQRGSNIVNNGYFYAITELLDVVFQLWLMQIIGFDNEMIDAVLNKNYIIRNRVLSAQMQGI